MNRWYICVSSSEFYTHIFDLISRWTEPSVRFKNQLWPLRSKVCPPLPDFLFNIMDYKTRHFKSIFELKWCVYTGVTCILWGLNSKAIPFFFFFLGVQLRLRQACCVEGKLFFFYVAVTNCDPSRWTINQLHTVCLCNLKTTVTVETIWVCVSVWVLYITGWQQKCWTVFSSSSDICRTCYGFRLGRGRKISMRNDTAICTVLTQMHINSKCCTP